MPSMRSKDSRHRRSAVLVLVALLGLAATAAAQEGLRLRGLNGETLSEADLTRGTTVVVVWASWSPRCRDIAPRVRALGPVVGGRARLVTVNFEEQGDAVRAFLKGADLGAPAYLDTNGAFARRYAISTLPGLLVLKNGEVAYRGQLPAAPESVLNDLLR
jgi:thiol-disulfide isomerase/thioredoxin